MSSRAVQIVESPESSSSDDLIPSKVTRLLWTPLCGLGAALFDFIDGYVGLWVFTEGGCKET